MAQSMWTCEDTPPHFRCLSCPVTAVIWYQMNYFSFCSWLEWTLLWAGQCTWPSIWESMNVCDNNRPILMDLVKCLLRVPLPLLCLHLLLITLIITHTLTLAAPSSATSKINTPQPVYWDLELFPCLVCILRLRNSVVTWALLKTYGIFWGRFSDSVRDLLGNFFCNIKASICL